MSYHLAEVNLALMRAPLDDPIMADFVAWLEEINALAESSTGFVWRLKTEEGDATSLRVFENEYIIVNMSVWESVETLYQYAYYSKHVEAFRRRGEWFERMETPILVMWWIPAGTLPTVQDAKAKLEMLQKHGATPQAFTFKQQFTVAEMLAAEQPALSTPDQAS